MFESEQVSERLRSDVARLAADIGPRDIYHYEALRKAADVTETALRDAGYAPLPHSYETWGRIFVNISAEVPGHGDEDCPSFGSGTGAGQFRGVPQPSWAPSTSRSCGVIYAALVSQPRP
jgi:hypothetical protein